jgi:hypothetical protein
MDAKDGRVAWNLIKGGRSADNSARDEGGSLNDPAPRGTADGDGADDEYPVVESKKDFERLLLAEAERLGCRQQSKRARIRCLAERCSRPEVLARAGEKEPLGDATLWRNLGETALPRWSTFNKLEAGTGTPLIRWLHALGRCPLEDAASLLDRALPRDAMSLTRQYLFDLAEALGPELEDVLIAFAETFARRRGLWPPPDRSAGRSGGPAG